MAQHSSKQRIQKDGLLQHSYYRVEEVMQRGEGPEHLTEERLIEERLTEERLTKERLTEEHLTEKRLTEERLTEERLTEERLTEDRWRRSLCQACFYSQKEAD